MSDELLRERGFSQLVMNIRDLNLERSFKTSTPAKIVIIGGSHSAFSIAWLLMNGPIKPR